MTYTPAHHHSSPAPPVDGLPRVVTLEDLGGSQLAVVDWLTVSSLLATAWLLLLTQGRGAVLTAKHSLL